MVATMEMMMDVASAIISAGIMGVSKRLERSDVGASRVVEGWAGIAE